MKKLIINADDFGVAESVNRGIIYGFQHGIITSTSLMVNRPYAEEAAQLAKENPGLGVGLHFEILANDNKFIRGSEIEEVLKTFSHALAQKQFTQQITKFQKLTDHLPDHIDGHQHVHRFSPFLPFVLEFSRKYKIPLRAVGKVNFINQFSDYLHPENASVENLINILKKLPDGVSELMTHAGYASEELRRTSSMSDCRETELKTLTSPEIKKIIKGEKIQLIRWDQI